jgi:hypothetical protein
MHRPLSQELLDTPNGIYGELHFFLRGREASLRHQSIEVNVPSVTSPQGCE